MKRARTLTLMVLLALPTGGWPSAAVRTVAGGGLGLLAGTVVTTGVVVARARFSNHYLESATDMVSWQGVGIPLGAVAGAVAGYTGWRVLGGVAAGAVTGGAAGAAVGVAVAMMVGDDSADRWAGGTMGGALGLLLGFVLGWARAVPRRGRAGPVARGAGVLAALGLAVAGAGCGSDVGEDVQIVESEPVPDDAAPVEDVIFLVGDPGKARYRRYPVVPRVAAEVEAWAERIGRDSAVTVLVLGDIVYPDGMHDPGDPGFAADSARVADQVAMVRAPGALEHAARMYFVAGNHDWGLHEDREGARRLRNLGEFLDRVRERGANVDLLPPAGSGVPHVVDIGDRLRLILLDTAWWLFDAEPNGKEAFVRGVADAMAGAGARQVVIAAHHPYASAGPHGGTFPVWKTLGIRQLLYRSGALLQDLESRPYRAMRRALARVFREQGRPLVFAGGHEHSLQVIAHEGEGEPRYSIVSGSASKLTGVGLIEGTMYQASAPGYVQLLVRENGAVDVQVMATEDRYLACPEDEPAELEWERCMVEGQAAFRALYSARLADPGSSSATDPTRPTAPSTVPSPDQVP